MPEQEKSAPAPWQVPVAVEQVAEEGRHFHLIADAVTRAAVARIGGLRELLRLEATFDVTRHGQDGLRVAGRVSGTVGQTCVVSLEPLVNEVAEKVDLVFVPKGVSKAPSSDEENGSPDVGSGKETEPLIGGSVNLGALATEFLLLGLDPYPRKPGAIFQPPADASADEGPFAALAALKKGGDGA
jgi:Large ribosomal RNA subunit accumulation protein YceD